MQPCNISHQIIKSVSCHFPGTVQINAVKAFHNLRMIGNLKIRNSRLAVFLNLHIFTVILSDRNTRINDVRNGHHDLRYLFVQLLFLCRKLFQTCRICSDLFFHFFCFLFFALSHQSADLFGKFVSSCTKLICFLLRSPSLCIQTDHLIHQRQLLILKFIFDILLYKIGIFPDKF